MGLDLRKDARRQAINDREENSEQFQRRKNGRMREKREKLKEFREERSARSHCLTCQTAWQASMPGGRAAKYVHLLTVCSLRVL